MIGHNKENQVVSSSSGDQDQIATVKKTHSSKKSSASQKIISPDQLNQLLKTSEVQHFILEADYALYQYVVDILLPKVLKPIPNSLTQLIRTFSKNLETWLNCALTNVPEDLRAIKVKAYILTYLLRSTL